MNNTAVFHEMDSPYCFPISKNEMVLRLRTAKDDIKSVNLCFESKYVIHEHHKMTPMYLAFSDRKFDYFEVRLKLKDTRLAYVFKLYDGCDEYYFSEDGITTDYDFSLGYYNFFQFPYINEADLIKPVEWMKGATFYQIFVDRFNMGKSDKDKSYINCKWGDIPTPHTFAGGDLKGITEKIGYLKGLGISAIYLTPVFRSDSNHKYDIIDYYNVDPEFGTNDDLKELINTAHDNGMKVVLDAVFNHTSDKLNEFQDVVKNGRSSRFYDWFIVKGDEVDKQKCNYETFAFCKYMPKLNTSNPEVQRFLLDIAVHYIKDYDIDGWRLDVSDEISHDFWKRFRKEVKAAKPDAVILGENWHNAYANLRGDEYDGIMNYAFTKAALDFYAYKSKDAEAVSYQLNSILMRNKEGINKMMLNLLDSHDTHRFFRMVKGDRNAVKSALAMLYFYEGASCIFYGTEILTDGGYDPDCRRCMDFDKTKKGKGYEDIRKLLTDLSKLKRKPSFYNAVFSVSCKEDMLVLTRTNGKNVYKLMINENEEARTYEEFTVEPHSFVIVNNERILING